MVGLVCFMLGEIEVQGEMDMPALVCSRAQDWQAEDQSSLQPSHGLSSTSVKKYKNNTEGSVQQSCGFRPAQELFPRDFQQNKVIFPWAELAPCQHHQHQGVGEPSPPTTAAARGPSVSSTLGKGWHHVRELRIPLLRTLSKQSAQLTNHTSRQLRHVHNLTEVQLEILLALYGPHDRLRRGKSSSQRYCWIKSPWQISVLWKSLLLATYVNGLLR